MKSIKLFWLALKWNNFDYDTICEKWLQCWYIIDNECSTKEVYDFLCSIDINISTTFYKTWKDITSRSRLDLYIDQVAHYITTYGSSHTGEPYIVNDKFWEKLDVDFKKFKIIKSSTKKEIILKCDHMLQSWIALNEETIEDIFTIFSSFEYMPNIDLVKNKEAKMQIHFSLGTIPKDNVEFLRFLIYIATKKSLIIKDYKTINTIIASDTDISDKVKQFWEKKLSEIFLRFKPIFLAFKKSNINNRPIINRLRKLAITEHKPYNSWFFETLLSDLSKVYTLPEKIKELNNFKKISLLEAIKNRCNPWKYSSYIIRNGKFFLKENISDNKEKISTYKLMEWIIYNSLIQEVWKHKWKKFYMPEYLDIKAPKSEKTFIGNIPMWTEIQLPNNDLILGINWREEDGANDFDLSFTNIDWGRLWWNAQFNDTQNDVTYSWDMTSASPEATELFYFWGNAVDWLLKNNKYHWVERSLFTFFIAKENIQWQIKQNHMVKKENILFQTKLVSIDREQILGIKTWDKFIIQNIISWNKQLSSWDDITTAYIKYTIQNQDNLVSLRKIMLDAWLIECENNNDVDYDFSDIKKDDIINILS